MEVLPCVQDKSSMDVKEFDETKAGVKGLVDSGITKIPKFFTCHPETFAKSYKVSDIGIQIPVIDLEGFKSSEREKIIIDEIREASEKWSIFRLINHGIPITVVDEMIAAARGFHEQPNEVKKELYSRDPKKSVRFYSNINLLTLKEPAQWMDTLALDLDGGKVDPAAALTHTCRDAVTEYVTHVIELKKTLCELLSEALGLDSDYLATTEFMERPALTCHYYPACPEPALTFGSRNHKDPLFLAILLNDNVAGLQVLHQNMWVDVPPVRGALVVNMGDLMQLITNDKFKSVEHRVLAGKIGPRVTVACFLYPRPKHLCKPFGPIKELVSNQPPKYRETHVQEYIAYYRSNGSSNPSLPHFKVQ
ncbi:1-aminocyclopropane-1-carboxylate oxidase homolog 1-like [Tripterygium wilfordii]|uniref:1-aminocyclopropane-1-carboxylate oxidase homolog 1-like n=1 Tax=Tripterygium wilfordii TaxID=458696 RepID=UPI0018F7E7AE|nr:1-aminocyclopropane-1-carboxylate oxidase homolog 1-like [Tripterygium wilfordii]